MPTVSPASWSPSECVSNDVRVSLCAAHKEAPGASFHVSPNWIRSSLSHLPKHHQKKPAIRNLSGSKADLLPPVFSLRAVLMVQWLKAVLMHHTSYLASVSFISSHSIAAASGLGLQGGPRCPKFPRIQSESERLQFNSTNWQKENKENGVATAVVPLSAWIDATLDVRDRATK